MATMSRGAVFQCDRLFRGNTVDRPVETVFTGDMSEHDIQDTPEYEYIEEAEDIAFELAAEAEAAAERHLESRWS